MLFVPHRAHDPLNTPSPRNGTWRTQICKLQPYNRVPNFCTHCATYQIHGSIFSLGVCRADLMRSTPCDMHSLPQFAASSAHSLGVCSPKFPHAPHHPFAHRDNRFYVHCLRRNPKDLQPKLQSSLPKTKEFEVKIKGTEKSVPFLRAIYSLCYVLHINLYYSARNPHCVRCRPEIPSAFSTLFPSLIRGIHTHRATIRTHCVASCTGNLHTA